MSGSCSIYVFFYAIFYFVTKVSFPVFAPRRFIWNPAVLLWAVEHTYIDPVVAIYF